MIRSRAMCRSTVSSAWVFGLRLIACGSTRPGRIGNFIKPMAPSRCALMMAVSVADGDLDTLILPHVNGACMQVFLDEVAARHPNDRIVRVLDGAGWHQSGSLTWPTISGYSNSRPTHPNSTLSNTSGMICVRSPFTTASSTVSMRSKPIWPTLCVTGNSITRGFAPSSHGLG